MSGIFRDNDEWRRWFFGEQLREPRIETTFLREDGEEKTEDPLVSNLINPVKAICPVVGNTEVRVSSRRSENYQGTKRMSKCMASEIGCPVERRGDDREVDVQIELNVNATTSKPRISYCPRELRIKKLGEQ